MIVYYNIYYKRCVLQSNILYSLKEEESTKEQSSIEGREPWRSANQNQKETKRIGRTKN